MGTVRDRGRRTAEVAHEVPAEIPDEVAEPASPGEVRTETLPVVPAAAPGR